MASFSFLRKMVFDGEGPPQQPAMRPTPSAWSADGVTGSCLGHSTVFLNFLGVRVLTDPVFSTRVGPGFGPLVVGPRRRVRPALRPKELPAPDLILLSHAHFDHLDARSLRRFSRRTPLITASRTADLVRRFRDVHELAWGESLEFAVAGAPVRVTAVPVAHWGARMIRDTFRGYNGYLLERGGQAVLFGGDTAYTDGFATLQNPRRPLALALMPIGAYDPWIRAHCTPEQAAAMARQAGAETFVPIHHETFRLSNEPMSDPARRIRAAFAHEPNRLLSVHVGETFRVPLR